ncbi:MAG: SAM-dependent methyltransferase, partial [Rikenellaceae bacterium]|nr:SAM-dependent methyltransferase [Rikenellaceae bacterium]
MYYFCSLCPAGLPAFSGTEKSLILSSSDTQALPMTTPNSTEHQKYPVHIVSLGPGDPDTVTIKSLRILRNSDCIFCPYTQTRHGRTSRTAGMLAQWEVPQTAILSFEVPMSPDRSRTIERYRELAAEIENQARSGKKVVLTVEG